MPQSPASLMTTAAAAANCQAPWEDRANASAHHRRSAAGTHVFSISATCSCSAFHASLEAMETSRALSICTNRYPGKDTYTGRHRANSTQLLQSSLMTRTECRRARCYRVLMLRILILLELLLTLL